MNPERGRGRPPEADPERTSAPPDAPEGHYTLPEWRGSSDIEGFDALDVNRVISVVDREAHDRRIPGDTLDLVTRDNIDEVIADGERRLRTLRERQNEESFTGTPSETIETLGDRASKSHAIQCSVNRAIDARATRDRIVEYAAERGVREDDRVLDYVGRTLDRIAAMSETLTALYKIDIRRRVGNEKADPAYFETALGAWPEAAARALEGLDRYEDENAAFLKGRDDMRKRIAALRERLAAPPATDDAAFYDGICEEFSRLILDDFEDMNEPRLITAAKWLESKAATRGK